MCDLGEVLAVASMWRPEDNFGELVLSVYLYMNSGDQTQIARPGLSLVASTFACRGTNIKTIFCVCAF